MAKEVTKAPTGLKITRTGNKFTASWKIGDKDYGDSQHFQYIVNDTGKGSWIPKNKTEIGHKTTSKVITTINKADYYPNVDKKGNNKPCLYTIGFRVKGNRKSYTTGSGKKKKTHKPSPSAWAKKEFTVEIPRIPSVVAELDEELTNVCKFTWSAPYYDDDTHIFTDVQWQTILVKNSAETDGSKLDWKNAEEGSGGAESSKTITEDTEILYKNGDSYVRWFRIRSRGPRGYTEWRYAYHVYALSHQANVTGTSASETDEGGFQCVVDWTVAGNRQNPIDKTTAQYTITIPDEGLTCPSGVSWSDANISRDTGEGDAAVFSIDDQLGKDQCLFIRVNTQHDSNITYGKPQLSAVGFLKDPSGLSVSTDNVTHKATISATNNSDVEDSILVVRYVPSSGDPIDIGVIPHNSSSVTVQCPNWDDQEAIAFDVYAMVGTATKQDREDGVDSYSIDAKMRSQNTITQGGAVPVAPQNVSVNRVEGKPDTVRVDWDWPWNEAGSAEISWSDHDDAWESTDEPESFLISNLHASHWNISGLETGKTWYVRVRLIAGNMTDSEDVTYGPWSDISQGMIDLSSAPNKPVLILSNSVIPEEGSTTASWVYTTTDNTAQSYAEVAIVDNGEYTPIAHSLTAQHVTIPAKSENYSLSTGNIYNLVCRVKSASGKLSEWSDIVSLTVAEPITCEIAQTSLVQDRIETNPREFGPDDSLSFETELEEDYTKLQVNLEPIQENTPWIGTEKNTAPYLFRAMPVQSNDYNRESLNQIVGATVGWNQLVDKSNLRATTTVNGVTLTNNGDGSFTASGSHSSGMSQFAMIGSTFIDVQANHKILCYVGRTVPNGLYVQIYKNNGATEVTRFTNRDGAIISITEDTNIGQWFLVPSAYTSAVIATVWPQYIDLTSAFGTTIADKAYTLEQSTTGSGIAWLKSYGFLIKDYYEYCQPRLESVRVSGHETTGFNQWDEEWELGYWNYQDNGNFVADSGFFACKNKIPVLPNTTYFWQCPQMVREMLFYDENGDYVRRMPLGGTVEPRTFTTDADNFFVAFYFGGVYGSTYNHDICINISDASINGTYYPYIKHTYPLDSTLTLNGILKLSGDEIYADGDVYGADGGVTRNFREVTPSANAWYYSPTSGFTYSLPSGYNTDRIRALTIVTGYDRFIGGWVSMGDKQFQALAGIVGIKDSSYSTIDEWKSHITNNPVTILFPITPTTETADPYTQIQICDPDGTEAFVDYGVESGDRDVAIPVGQESTYSLVCPVYGHDEINTVVCGKNLYPAVNGEVSSGGTTKFSGLDGTYKHENVYSSSISTSGVNETMFTTVMGNVTLPKGTYVLSLASVETYNLGDTFDPSRFRIICTDDVTGQEVVFRNNGTSVTTNNSVTLKRISYDRGYGILPGGYISYKIQLELGSTATAYEPYQGRTITTDLPQTVYGGTLDVVTGELVVTMALADMGDFAWAKESAFNFFYAQVATKANGTNFICSQYENVGVKSDSQMASVASGSIATSSPTSKYFCVKDTNYTTASEFKTAMNGVQLAYELATPQTYQLTPQQLETLKGLNKIESESGQVEIRIVESIWEANVLKEIPLAITVTGAGDGGITTIMVERAEDYPMERPDETSFHGNKGEVVLQTSPPLIGTNQVSFDVKDLIGPMDDGAAYNIVATVQDGLGQTDYAILPFEVHWAHQAEEPSAEIEIDEENLIAFITPIAPENADPEDVADIYRLSADRPELIVEGAEFGETYVDPYPALGDMGGHRIVTRTKNGDYITEDNQIAMVDSPELGVNPIENEDLLNIIDFEGRQIQFYWETDYSNTWAKDFQETQYLGGSIEGDWNPAVSRSGTLSSKAITVLDQEMLKDVRRLADYPGICHVRTADGSSYAADVQVSEDYTDDEKGMVTNYSLSITKVDPQGFEGMTKDQWDEENPPEEEEEP